MTRQRLDSRDRFPSGMEEYLSHNGWHFNKLMCEWAVKMLKQQGNGSPMTKEQVDELLKRFSVSLERTSDYDYVYAANLARSVHWGSAIADEQHLAKSVKDCIDGPNGYDEMTFTRFYADCIGRGIPIMWTEYI